jgi:hypothetical protein
LRLTRKAIKDSMAGTHDIADKFRPQFHRLSLLYFESGDILQSAWGS